MTDRILERYGDRNPIEPKRADAYRMPERIGVYVMTDGPMCDQLGWIG